jgi:cytochrome oxidase assembly protein ShyY1
MMVALALPVLVGLGLWQISRMHWKEQLLAQMERNRALPPATRLQPDIGPLDMLFRQARLDVICKGPAREKAGRNLAGEPGYSVFLPCTSGGVPLLVNLGWGPRPDTARNAALPSGPVSGMIVPSGPEGGLGLSLVLESAMPPLEPSAPPGPETIPNNHRLYAIQWFSFAGILLAIYGLWLRRWVAQRPPRA